MRKRLKILVFIVISVIIVCILLRRQTVTVQINDKIMIKNLSEQVGGVSSKVTIRLIADHDLLGSPLKVGENLKLTATLGNETENMEYE